MTTYSLCWQFGRISSLDYNHIFYYVAFFKFYKQKPVITYTSIIKFLQIHQIYTKTDFTISKYNNFIIQNTIFKFTYQFQLHLSTYRYLMKTGAAGDPRLLVFKPLTLDVQAHAEIWHKLS